MGITPRDYEIVTASRVACDGGEGALGHPRVYLTVDPKKGYVICPYCDKLFVAADRADEVLAAFGLKPEAAT
ncbi:MAG: zinc-finger domain-containing protein [Pseudomonadota bacterium]